MSVQDNDFGIRLHQRKNLSHFLAPTSEGQEQALGFHWYGYCKAHGGEYIVESKGGRKIEFFKKFCSRFKFALSDY